MRMSLVFTPRTVALVILTASLTLAGVMALRDPRAPALAFAVLGWGTLACAVAMGIGPRSQGEVVEHIPPRLVPIRAAHAAVIAQLQSRATAHGYAELVSLLRDGLATLNEEIIPALRQLMAREDDYTKHFGLYESGELPTPDPGVLEHLRTSHMRQREAIESSIRRLVSAEARLFPSIHQLPDPNVRTEVEVWLQELETIHRSLADALRTPGNVEPSLPADIQPVPAVDPATGQDRERIAGLVQQALHHLNKPSALARCELIHYLERTIEATRASWSTGPLPEATPLEQAQALRAVLNGAIDRLKNAGDADSPAPQYQILHREYREGMQTSHIATRLSIAPSTLFRWRAEAVKAIAEDLWTREEALATKPPPLAGSRSSNPNL
jgi:hypothetical protein